MDDATLRALFARITAKDKDAFAELVKLTEGRLRAYLCSVTGNGDDADDLLQETYWIILRLLSENPSTTIDRPLGWMCRIALNLSLNERRRQQRHDYSSLDGENVPEAPDHRNPNPPDSAVVKEGAARVHKALSRILELYRTPIVLRYFEGLKDEEIARILDICLSSVRSRVYRGLRQLRELLQDLGDE